MTDNEPLSPLDDAFVSNLVWRVGVDDHLIGAAAQRYWKAVLARFPVARFVAERFNRGEWVDNEDWFVDPGIQEVFQGYDWRRYTGQDRPVGTPVITAAPQIQALGTPVQGSQAGVQTTQTPSQPQSSQLKSSPALFGSTESTPAQSSQAGGQKTQTSSKSQSTLAQSSQVHISPALFGSTKSTPAQSNKAGGQQTQTPSQPQSTPAKSSQAPTSAAIFGSFQGTPAQSSQAGGQPAQKTPLPSQGTPAKSIQAPATLAMSNPFLSTPTQSSQAGSLPAQTNPFQPKGTLAQSSQAPASPATFNPFLSTPAQTKQTGLQNTQTLPTSQSQIIPTGDEINQTAPPGQVPSTPRGQTGQTGSQGGQALPTPQSQTTSTGSRTGQDTPPIQNPIMAGMQGQAQHVAGGLTSGSNVAAGNVPQSTANMQGTPTGQQAQAASSVAATSQGNRGGRRPRLPRSIYPSTQGNLAGQQPQTGSQVSINTQGSTTGQQPPATTNAQTKNGGRQPKIPGTIPPSTQASTTGQQPQTGEQVPVRTQPVTNAEAPQDDGIASKSTRADPLAALARRLIPPVLSAGRRLPSPPYDDQADLDKDLQQTQDQSGQPAQAPLPADDGSIPQPMQPSLEDMEGSHTWRGQRLPPLGVRLTHLKNFLSDEDVDRDISWKEHIDEAEAYLVHVKSDREFWNVGRETRDMVDRLLEMVAAHRIFERYHYGTFNSTKIFTPDIVNKPAPRLRYDPNFPIVLRGRGGRPGSQRAHDIMPGDFPDQPRRQGRVNDMWTTEREARAGLTDALRAQHQVALAQAEDALWQLESDAAPPKDNLSYVENRMYEDIVAADRGRGLDGWVNTSPAADGGPGLERWCAGPTFLGDCAESFARERGARRAGLQGALRQFRNMENQLACTPWRRLVLPPTREELRLARESAGAGDGRKWPFKTLPRDKMRKTQGKDDPQGFTVAMAQFWRDQRRLLDQAREAVTGAWGGRSVQAGLGEARHPRWVTPPASIWGPYVWRAVDPETQDHQDLLKQMRAAKKLFDRELRIAQRHLLTHMDELYRLGYTNQGLNQGSVVFQDPQTKVNVVVNFHPRRDVIDGSLADLDKMEMYWIRFILNSSITTLMTDQIEPRASIFIVFSERLNSIFNDISDPLFPSNVTKVSVEDLLDYMHRKTDGPVKMVKFYAYDAQRWLARLAVQGRCRYEDDWRCYGWVQRPVPDCHPENLINWQVSDQDEDTKPSEYPEDMVFAPRLKDVRAWGDIIHDGKPPEFLCGDVTNYFQCLAYRWGRYMHKLENPDNGLEKGWKTKATEPHDNIKCIIDDIEVEYRNHADWNQEDNSWDNNPLVSLIKRTLPEKESDATMGPDASIQIIRDHVIDEAVRNDTMLWPARNAYSYTDNYDEKVRPPLWDWAKVEVRGPIKGFFDVNRWPLQLQTEDRVRRITSDMDLSVQQLWNPITEDPTPWTLYRPKARPYTDAKVKHREGHRIYPIGDTPRQKKVVENQMYATIGRAMGLPDTSQARRGIISRLSGLFSRGGNDDDDDHVRPGSRLPKVNPKDIPKSYDPRADADRKRKAVDDARDGPTKAARLTGDHLPDDIVQT